ncbi:MAG: thioredoxin domain-containing protein [bacterium]|nr:thioredoxin domain-containing protein [bacterium]
MNKDVKEFGAQQRERKRQMRRFLMWGGVVLVLAGIIWLMVKAASLGPQALSAGLAPEITSADWTLGNKNAKVTLIEYGDFQCPACAAYHPIVKQLVNEYQDRILFVARHFPLSQHLFALPSAYAVEAAGAQGKFWEMYDKIYENQKSWLGSSNPQSQLEVYATEFGLDLAKFKIDAGSKAIKDKVAKDLAGGIAGKIDHTPTFFINLKQIPNPQSYDEFRTKLEQALADSL